MGLFSRKRIYIENDNFPQVINKLAIAFEALREDYIFGSLSQLKREGIDVSEIPRTIIPGSDLENILKGFQLTSMIGIAWNYIKDAREQLDFDKSLSRTIKAEEGTRAWHYRNGYVDCRGDIDTLAKTLSVDIHKSIGMPEPKKEFLIQFQRGAEILIGLCQVATHTACGDDKMAKALKKRMGLPYSG